MSWCSNGANSVDIEPLGHIHIDRDTNMSTNLNEPLGSQSSDDEDGLGLTLAEKELVERGLYERT